MLTEKIKNLPTNPGVYLMYDSDGVIIYVGKAKNLKNRVTSYFRGGSHTPKVSAMVSNIANLDYIITDSELEALVLECNLIKKHRPKYNILLKDDKAYPFIKVTVNEEYPRIVLARRVENDGARYFGPYLSSFVVRETIDLAKKVFAIRSCKRNLPRDIGKSRPCLNFHIGQCTAPCDNRISQAAYRALFDQIITFLEGDQSGIVSSLTEQMRQASDNLEFERAARLRDKLSAIDRLSQKQKIVSTTQGNQDIIALAQDGKTVCIQVFFVRGGKVSGRETHIVKNADEASITQLLTDFVKQYYGMATFIPKNILLQAEIEDMPLIEQWLSEKCRGSIKITVPQRGEKAAILNMAMRNATEELALHLIKSDVQKRKKSSVLFALKDLLSLPAFPMRIEAYDISNTSGSDSVGVCVVFENGLPKKSGYKKFNIRTVEGADDYESIKEVVYRRISNGVEGEQGFAELPDLLLIDGGKGQVQKALEVLTFFDLDIPVYGMVKDDRHRTRALVTADAELSVKMQTAVFNLLTTIQDEVHRFAIESHRKKRKKTAIASELESIEGVGEKRRVLLLKHFKTVKAIKNATADELAAVRGIDRKTAERIHRYFAGSV